MPLDPNTRLGPYEILSLAGEGGMGAVYRARDTRLGRSVAVKVIDKQFSTRFENEARAISTLNHPNICTLFDIGPNYLVMEFVEGETLTDRLKRGALPIAEALPLAISIADALAAAHAKSMAHRDLKPGNVMITPEGRVKLLDFGLAKMLESSDQDVTRTVEGAVVGTLAYMSPEQLQGRPAGTSADIYTFGAVLYEMLSGRRAFESGFLREEPPSLNSISPEIAAIVSRCLRRAPEERYPAMTEIKSALEKVGHPAPAPPRNYVPSIAVLPFANMSGDKENEYFSDGLAEEILNELTRVPGLKVIARTSAFAFKDKHEDIRKIAETLGVSKILEGSVRRSGNRVRVTAQLITATDGSHLWSDRYDRDMTDVFAVQDEIAQAIVSTLKLKFSKRAPCGPANMDAYHALLKARYHCLKVNPEDSARATAYCDEAIALDPDYALAHAERSACLFTEAQQGFRSVRATVPLIREAAHKALELDPAVPVAHTSLACVAASVDYDWKEALRLLSLSSNTDPSMTAICAQSILLPLRRFDEVVDSMERGIAADPLSHYPRFILAQALQGRGDYGAARKALDALMELHKGHLMSYFGLGMLLTMEKKTGEAIAILERGMVVAPWFPPQQALLAANYHHAGDTAKAETIVHRLESMSSDLKDISLGNYNVLCSNFDRAADYLQVALDRRHFAMMVTAYNPLFEEFRKHPRGQALLAQMNLSEIGAGPNHAG